MAELRALGARIEEFRKAGARLVAISGDTVEDTRAMVAKRGFNFTVLSDPGLSVARSLGMVHPKAKGSQDASRPGTIVVDREGRIRWFFTDSRIRNRPDPEEVLAQVRAAR